MGRGALQLHQSGASVEPEMATVMQTMHGVHRVCGDRIERSTGHIWNKKFLDFGQTLSFLNFWPSEGPDFLFVAFGLRVRFLKFGGRQPGRNFRLCYALWFVHGRQPGRPLD